MASLLARGVGLLVRSMAGLSSTQATRCSNLPSAVSVMQCTTARWFTKRLTPDDFPKPPPPEEPPKRPLSPYFRFAKERRQFLASQHPEASVLEVAKLLGKEWRALSETEKQVYIDDARAETLKYRESFKQYKENLNPLDREILLDKKKQRAERRKTMRLKREKTILGKPKRCRTAFNIYLAEHFHEAKGDSLPSKLKYMRNQWEHLSSTKKQVYTQLAEDDKVRYENELKAWEDQMIEIGREDLVRYKVRIRLSKKRSSEMTSHKKVQKAFIPSEGRRKGHRHPEE